MYTCSSFENRASSRGLEHSAIRRWYNFKHWCQVPLFRSCFHCQNARPRCHQRPTRPRRWKLHHQQKRPSCCWKHQSKQQPVLCCCWKIFVLSNLLVVAGMIIVNSSLLPVFCGSSIIVNSNLLIAAWSIIVRIETRWEGSNTGESCISINLLLFMLGGIMWCCVMQITNWHQRKVSRKFLEGFLTSTTNNTTTRHCTFTREHADTKSTEYDADGDGWWTITKTKKMRLEFNL